MQKEDQKEYRKVTNTPNRHMSGFIIKEQGATAFP